MRVTIRCDTCGQKLRFPVNKGKIRVICPHCGSQFIFNPAIKEILKAIKKLSKDMFNWLRALNLTSPEGFYRFKTEVETKTASIFYMLKNFNNQPRRTKIIIGIIVVFAFIMLYRGCYSERSIEMNTPKDHDKKITI